MMSNLIATTIFPPATSSPRAQWQSHFWLCVRQTPCLHLYALMYIAQVARLECLSNVLGLCYSESP